MQVHRKVKTVLRQVMLFSRQKILMPRPHTSCLGISLACLSLRKKLSLPRLFLDLTISVSPWCASALARPESLLPRPCLALPRISAAPACLASLKVLTTPYCLGIAPASEKCLDYIKG